MDDTQLRETLDLVRQGDRDAFEALYEEMKTPLFTVLYRITQDRALSEDLLQEVFVKLFRTPPPSSVRKPRAYLFQSARNLALDALRRQKPWAGLDSCAHLPGDDPAEHLLRLDLEQALAQLDLSERQIVALHLNGGLTFREIAAGMGLPLGTALWKYRKAIARLRSLLNGGTL